jgi:hypothetical protein
MTGVANAAVRGVLSDAIDDVRLSGVSVGEIGLNAGLARSCALSSRKKPRR